jgi:CBS domain containing-hemolysin-like protein
MLFVALFLVVLNGFFVATEFAIVKVRVTRLRELARSGNANAKVAHEVVGQLDAYLSACQLGITLASLGLGWVGEPAFAHLLQPLFASLGPWAQAASHAISLTFAFVMITLLHIVYGELAPKAVAIRYAEATALAVAHPIRIFYRLFYPLIWAMNGLANATLRVFGLTASWEDSAHSEEELRLLLSDSGGGDRRRALLEQALDFSSRRVRQIMVPRADVSYLDVLHPVSEILDAARRDGYTRYPVCRDHLDEVIGIVHVRDLFAAVDRLQTGDDVARLAREPLFVPESATAEQLLRLFQQRRMHMAIVVDEYGGTSGIATLEDVLEELTGEIQDEFDTEAPAIEEVGDGTLRVGGGLPVADLARKLEAEIDSDESVTVGGLVQDSLGRVAHTGDLVRVGELGLMVLETRSRRVVRVLAGPYEAVARKARKA